MKLTFILFFLTFAHFAQASVAGDVCNTIAAQSLTYGQDCAADLSKGPISDSAAQICMSMVAGDYTAATACIAAAANVAIDPTIAGVCASIAKQSPTYGTSCLQAAAGKVYSPDLAKICQTVSNQDYVQGASCVRNSGKVGTVSAPPTSTSTPTCLTKDQIIYRVSVARYAIDHNRQVNASKILSDLEDSLKTCH